MAHGGVQLNDNNNNIAVRRCSQGYKNERNFRVNYLNKKCPRSYYSWKSIVMTSSVMSTGKMFKIYLIQ